MRDYSHSQVFTVFGASYITENHGTCYLPQAERHGRSGMKVAAAAALLMLGITAATATKSTRFWDGLRPQASHSTWMAASFEDVVY